MSNVYELPMSRDYVRHWGLSEAVRELLQNALDSDSPFEYAFEDDALTITSRFSTLEAKTLVLGATSKADKSDKIGSFGEGYKLALLVLAREGKRVAVRNGSKLWTPCFLHSPQYGAEVFCIEEAESGLESCGVQFIIAGLSEEEQEAIRATCLLMQPAMADVIGTRFGHILPSRPGKLYVGGLFVCDTGLQFGYDVKPEYLRLERDRQTVSGFELKWQAKEMWLDTKRFEQIAEMLEGKVPDLEYIEHGCPELLKEACYRQFRKNNPGAVAVKSQEEMQRMVAKGMTKTVYVSPTYHAAVTTSKSYVSEMAKAIRVKSPREALEEWLQEHQREMRLPVRIAFKTLLAEAEKWRAA